MYRIGLAMLCCLLLACSGNTGRGSEQKKGSEEKTSTGFGQRFTAASLPYQLADSTLLSNRDTASLPAQTIASFVPDSTLKQVFGKTSGIKYTALAKLEQKDKEAYYIVKASAGGKKAALLFAFDKGGNFGAALPFLVPDGNPATSQTSTIDKSYVVTKSVTERSGDEVTGEGKEVWSFDAKAKAFSLVMTDLLNDNPAVLVNPIDTFPRLNKLTGDYFLNKKNLVAVRDGRHTNQILVYIHTENSEGDCKGELKGEFILTSSTTAVYRQGGDPCVLGLTFSENSVSIHEESGCGNYRGLDCPFGGSFTRKKEEKPKDATSKPKRKKQSPQQSQ